MGTNIHILFQVYDPQTKKWLLVKREGDKFVVVEDKDIPVFVAVAQGDPSDEDRTDEVAEEFYNATSSFWFGTGRDYIFFAKVADVRNDTGLLDVREPRGIPEDLSTPVRLLMEDGDHHSHTWLVDTEIEALNMDEAPITKCTYFVHVNDYESLKKKLLQRTPDMEINSRNIAHHCPYDTKPLSGVRGFIYTVEEWEAFDDKRKERERSRPLPYGEKKNNVYIEASDIEKVNYGGLKNFKKHLSNLKEAFPGQQIRALINFDS